MNRKIIRCAIYTRKSTEEGLEQDFNSLDAQREAGEAFIKSQKHEGWEIINTQYDDGGYSGGNMERPALKQLLADITAGKIDVIVVYKVDRLSRALSDFAKMVEVFDKHNVSFVSVTQQFNTTTSMGRLTLNVLLSFAQFEREVTGERIRDKFAASKKKGMWMGGPVPLGYDVKDRKLIINEPEAEIIRYIYSYYIDSHSKVPLRNMLDILSAKSWKNKSYTSNSGNNIIGKEFNLNQIYSILKNPIYNGKISHKGTIYNGEHEAIIPDEIWNAVHGRISKREFVINPHKKSEQPKLLGRIFDYLGNRLTSTYSYKYTSGGRYKMRYYVNRELQKKGKTNSEFKRIRADYLDDFIEQEITKIIENKIETLTASNDPVLISSNLRILKELKYNPILSLNKITLFPEHVELQLSIIDELITINLPIKYKRLAGKLIITTPDHLIETPISDIEKQYHHPDDKTFVFIAKAFYFNKVAKDDVEVSPLKLSKKYNQNKEYVKRALRQKYLSPKIIEEIVNYKNATNQNSDQISVEKLCNTSYWCWECQEKALIKSI